MDDLNDARRGGRGPGRSPPRPGRPARSSSARPSRWRRIAAPVRAVPLAARRRGRRSSSRLDHRAGHPVPGPHAHRRRDPRTGRALLLWAVGGMLAVTVVTAVFGVVQTWLSTTVGQQVMHGLRTAVFAHLQRQSLGFFTRTRGGEVQSRLTNDIGGMQSVVTSTATSVASNPTTVVGTAVAMAALSWRLSLLSLIVLPPAVWLTRRVARMRRDDHRPAPAAPRRPARARSRRACRSAACCSARRSAPAPPSPRGSPRPRRPGRPRGALAARRPLADGHDEHRLRRHPRADLPGRGPARDRPAA